MNIGFTGSQDGMSRRQKETLKQVLTQFNLGRASTFRQGMCIGADTEAVSIAVDSTTALIVGYPPLNTDKMDKSVSSLCDELKPPQDYLIRNHAIVDESDLLIAAPSGHLEVQRSGTWATVRYARRQNKPCIILDR